MINTLDAGSVYICTRVPTSNRGKHIYICTQHKRLAHKVTKSNKTAGYKSLPIAH